MTRKEYKAFADAIRTAHEDGVLDDGMSDDFARILTPVFIQDNADFNETMFRVACGIEE